MRDRSGECPLRSHVGWFLPHCASEFVNAALPEIVNISWPLALGSRQRQSAATIEVRGIARALTPDSGRVPRPLRTTRGFLLVVKRKETLKVSRRGRRRYATSALVAIFFVKPLLVSLARRRGRCCAVDLTIAWPCCSLWFSQLFFEPIEAQKNPVKLNELVWIPQAYIRNHQYLVWIHNFIFKLTRIKLTWLCFELRFEIFPNKDQILVTRLHLEPNELL